MPTLEPRRLRPWILRVLVGASLAAALFLILFPLFARAEHSTGPSETGIARGAALDMARYYAARPEDRVAAWSNAAGRAAWLPESSGRGGWIFISKRLERRKAALEVAPEIVGRRWREIGEDEPVLVVRSNREGDRWTRRVAKSGALIRARS